MTTDSRRYVIAYEFGSREEAPGDFGGMPPFERGLFLPRGSGYPPRVALLTAEGVWIVAHPSAQEPSRLLRFGDIAFAEAGAMLLRGWLRFVGGGLDVRLPYNRRGAPAVDAFSRAWRGHFLAAGQRQDEPGAVDLDAIDLKFRYALEHELDGGEAVRWYCFQAAAQVTRRMLGLQRTRTEPADLVALTSRRIVWITDRDGRGYARYGSIVRYAPLSRVAAIGRQDDALRIAWSGDAAEWRIQLGREQWEDARLEMLSLPCR